MSAHQPYFANLESLLQREGDARPTAVIDLDRVAANVAELAAGLAPRYAGSGLRLVNKSLPCPRLLRFVAEQLGCHKQMVFHWPFLVEAAREFPDHDFLFGKPMPVKAAATALERLGDLDFDADKQVAWLIDSGERLAQYQQLASERGLRLRLVLEIDIGLHRGGLSEPAALAPLLESIAADPRHLEFAGFLGYDAHVGKLPSWLESKQTSLDRSQRRYQAFVDWGQAHFAGLFTGEKIYNGAGSPTFLLHREQSPVNEVAVGSVLVKPSHFDLPGLESFAPAFFIATPVLKSLPGLALPGLEGLSRRLGPVFGRHRTYFIYGGRFVADPLSPAGLRKNDLYGQSFNQAILNGPAAPALAVDDWVFFRPQEAESVLLQFGDLLVVQGGEVVGRWPVFKEN